TPGVVPTQEAAQFGSAAEVLYTASDETHLLGSQAEMLVTYDAAVAAVSDISGPSATLATFDGTTSLGWVAGYQWNWVSVPVGSLLGSTPVPYPNFGAITPIDMTSNVLLYHTEEAAGTSGLDTSGTGNTAALTAITVGVGGQVGSYAWEFTGATSKAVPTAVVPIGSSWTVAYWFLGLAPNTSWRTGIRGTGNHHIIVENGADRLGLYIGGFRPTDTGFTMPVGSYTGWHHIAAVGTAGGDTQFYIDGLLVGTVVGFRPTDSVVCVGNYQGDGQRFADRIDEFALWTRELSGSEIQDIYDLQKGFAGSDPTFTFLPDVDGTYTINLTVTSGIDGGLTVDTADAVIGGSTGILFPLQGDQIRMWGHLQGQGFRRRNEK
ncbi:LamG domain-containing protein, partial [Deltaproteobacteria bacterium]|nr:LamG domain-containing protein [Deltaproteobacteria bacterium]